MATMSKRKKAGRSAVDSTRAYEIDAALDLVKDLANARFSESIDVAVNLGIEGDSAISRGGNKSVTVVPPGKQKTH